MTNARAVGWLICLLCVFAPDTAQASPWTLGRGVALMRTDVDFQVANSEFIDRGGQRAFPLNASLSAATLDIGLRLGITDRIELEFGVPVRSISYASDPAILRTFQGTDANEALAFYQDNIVDFSRSTTGIGDIRVKGRYQIALRPVAFAIELGAKIPSGYEGPRGTFGRAPATVEEFESNRDAFVRPDRIQDDVTLGDGQVDLSAQLLAGAAFSSGTFVRGSVGYNLRLAGAGDQVLGDMRIGQALGSRFLVFAFGRVAYSIQDGRGVGVSLTAIDPELPASSFTDFENARGFVRPLESNSVDVGGGLIWRVTGPVELNTGYSRTVWGRFVAATNTLSIGIGIRLDVFETRRDS